MNKIIMFTFLSLICTNSFASLAVNCVVPSRHIGLFLLINENRTEGTLREGTNPEVAVTSPDGKTFTGEGFFGAITLSPSIYTQPASKTHAILETNDGGRQILNCLKRKVTF
jgi:hypothetical protein